jgi:hypothetical protein
MPDPAVQLSLQWIAGIFALFGVVVGQILLMFSAWSERKHRRKELLLSKLDELAMEDRALQHWLKADFQTKESVVACQACDPELPCSKIEVLSSIYFERLKQPVSNYTQSLRSFYKWAFEVLPQLPNVSNDGRLPNPLSWCLARHDKDSFERHLRDIQSCRRTLSESVSTEAKRLLG